MRGLVAVILGTIFFLEPLLTIRAGDLALNEASSQDTQGQPATAPAALPPATEALRQRLSDTPSGSNVEVRLLSKQKVQGLLQGVQTDKFILQTANEQGVQNQEIKFEEVKNVRVYKLKGASSVHKAGSKVGRVLIVVGAAAVAIFVLGFINYMNRS